VNLLEELQNLDINDIGRWPLLFRAAFVTSFLCITLGAGFFFLVYEEQMPRLERAEQEEKELKGSFEQKQKKAANFNAYKEQLAEIERSFGTMLRQLPGKTEIPNLLIDISQTGLAAGLQEELFQPSAEIRKDFYAEKPITMRLTGSYHEFGRFVSDIAALPRIVTLHDIQITPIDRNAMDDNLVLRVTAKTYRYLDDGDSDSDEAGATG
jgi:type IV pilus assembly protein PilO